MENGVADLMNEYKLCFAFLDKDERNCLSAAFVLLAFCIYGFPAVCAQFTAGTIGDSL